MEEEQARRPCNEADYEGRDVNKVLSTANHDVLPKQSHDNFSKIRAIASADHECRLTRPFRSMSLD